jgi:hypothetical protein
MPIDKLSKSRQSVYVRIALYPGRWSVLPGSKKKKKKKKKHH